MKPASTSLVLSTPRALVSSRRLRAFFGLGLLAALSGALPGCGVEAPAGRASTPGEQVGEASQALAPTCVTIVRGGVGGVADTRLRQDTPTTAYGSVTTIVTGNQVTNRVALMRFDLSPIPAGAVVTSADVTLDEVQSTGASTVSVHAATAAWSEATATWNSFNNAYSAAETTSFSNGGAGHTGAVSFGIASLVQGWVDGAANDGIVMVAPTNTTWSSSEATNLPQRPSLAVCYLPPAGVAPGNAIALAAGEEFSIALKLDGTVWSVGRNLSGELGDGTVTDRLTPVQALALPGVTAVAAGQVHSLLLNADGTVWGMGDNSYGQLGAGVGGFGYQPTPIPVLGLSGIVAVAGGWHHSVALKSDGTVWSLGINFFGELGDGTTTLRSTPVQAVGLSGITAIAAGGYHSMALKSDGTVWAVGHNGYGQLGDGTQIDRHSPVQIAGLSGITAVAAGYSHSLALKSDGTVWAMGDNTSGQLGDGTTIRRLSPVQVLGLSGVIAIAAGEAHSLALKSDGTVWGVGSNYLGQLGDGTTVQRYIPVQAFGLSGITALAASGFHSLALRSDGAVWASGWNGYGQLGDGTTNDRSIPVQSLLP